MSDQRGGPGEEYVLEQVDGTRAQGGRVGAEAGRVKPGCLGQQP